MMLSRRLYTSVLILCTVLPGAASLLVFPSAAVSGSAGFASIPEEVGPDGGSESSGRVTWGIAPTNLDGEDDRVSFRFAVAPGAQVTDNVLVTNYSDQLLTFDLLANDGIVTDDGVFDLQPSSVKPVDVGSWIKIASSVEVGPLASAVAPFTLTVPSDASPGDHPGGIVAALSYTSDGVDGPQVGFETRVGTRIHLRVTGELIPRVAISDLSVRYETSWNPFAPGTVHVRYTVKNSGNVRLGSTQTVGVTGPFGLPTGAIVDQPLAQQREVLPRQSAKVRADISGVWPVGPLSTHLAAKQHTVGDDNVDATLTRFHVSTTAWAVPWPQLILLAVLASVITGTVVVRKRRRQAHTAAIQAARLEGARAALAAPDAPFRDSGVEPRSGL